MVDADARRSSVGAAQRDPRLRSMMEEHAALLRRIDKHPDSLL